jgi:Xaa-Pro dipeptidase
MAVTRRNFLITSAAGAGIVGAMRTGLDAQNATDRPGGPPPPADPGNVPAVIKALKPMTGGVAPITDQERQARIEKARRLMREHQIGAIMLEGGSSLYYFTGVTWSLSERPFVAVIPAQGEIGWVCPGFEEARARELVKAPHADVRVWQEDESPYERIASILKDRGVTTGHVGVEERLRFFIFDGVRRAAPGVDFVSADPVTAGCRMIKSPAEIAIMKRANEITLTAYKAALSTLKEGMSAQDLRRNIFAAYNALGIQQAAALVLFGKYTAFPHGTTNPQTLREGDNVLVDDGCSLHGYQSDVTRTIVFGKPTQHQRDVWNLEKKAQAAAFAAVKPGVPCEAVDAAARKVITDAGYGPGYKVPGLPHRTGHGIGIDGHEWTNFVKGNKTPLAPGMCFSDEPMITNYAEFGVRLEDCLHVTENGAEFFTPPALSIDDPFGNFK